MKLSVIMPAYNVAAYLNDSLVSLKKQSMQDFEVLVIDDGSVDRTADVARVWSERDSRFTLISTPNAGSAAARNRGLDSAQGEYVAFLDADDWVDADMYERLLAPTDTVPYDSVGCDLTFELPASSLVESSTSREGAYSRVDIEHAIFPHLLTSERLTRDWPYRMVTKVYRRQHLVDHGIRFAEELRAAQDFTFSVEAMYKAENFFYLKGSNGYHYRQNPTSRTNSGLARAWLNYRALDAELARIVGGDDRFADQLALAELHGDLSSLSYLYRGLRAQDRGSARTTMESLLGGVNRSRAFAALDWTGVPFAKGVACRLIRRRRWFLLHQLLVARSVIESRRRGRLLAQEAART